MLTMVDDDCNTEVEDETLIFGNDEVLEDQLCNWQLKALAKDKNIMLDLANNVMNQGVV
jgi:hypothetical protein